MHDVGSRHPGCCGTAIDAVAGGRADDQHCPMPVRALAPCRLPSSRATKWPDTRTEGGAECNVGPAGYLMCDRVKAKVTCGPLDGGGWRGLPRSQRYGPDGLGDQ